MEFQKYTGESACAKIAMDAGGDLLATPNVPYYYIYLKLTMYFLKSNYSKNYLKQYKSLK